MPRRQPAAAPTVPSGKHLPGPPRGLGVSRRTVFCRIFHKEVSENLAPAAGHSRRQKQRAEKGCEAWGTRVTPQARAGATTPRTKEGLAPSRTPSLPQPGGSGRAQAPIRSWSPHSPWTADRDRQKVPTLEGQGARRHFNLLRAAHGREAAGDLPPLCGRRILGREGVHLGSPGHVTLSSCWLLGHLPQNPEHCSQTRQRKPIIFSSRWDEEALTRFWVHSVLQLPTEYCLSVP